MPSPFPKLPVDLQSFQLLREKNFLYVDKTAYIHRMLEEGRYYFLARPRRLGKSLTVSTLRCLFEGRRELFEGLWMGERGDWDWQPHPVVQFDFNTIPHDGPETFALGIERSLKKIASAYGITLEEPLPRQAFQELVLRLYEKTARVGVKNKRLKAAWDNRYLANVLFGK